MRKVFAENKSMFFHSVVFVYEIPTARKEIAKHNPQNVVTLGPDNGEHYVLPPKPVLRATPKLLEPKQSQSAVSPKTFTAQEAKNYSIAELTKIWNRVFLMEQSDTNLKL